LAGASPQWDEGDQLGRWALEAMSPDDDGHGRRDRMVCDGPVVYGEIRSAGGMVR
jgi:hypothetical protein